ncbi:HHK17, histidine kinase-group VII protein [Cadophora sp. MPI-SDFR-AT-0126]|nr:HHK17, histidine kinase-group VII protein [Leotiomycetes sp. MPI-SDFR-AT-0126]
MHEISSFPNAFEARPCGPRTYRPLRQRARGRLEKDQREPFVRQTGEGAMDTGVEEGDAQKQPIDSFIERTSLCLPDYANDAVLHRGDGGFTNALRQYFPSAESNATERLMELKSRLRSASTHDFWAILMEEMCDITGSQCGYVAKRILVDDQDSAIEMPALGDPGSCLMGVAFYINNGKDGKQMYRDYRYHAFGTPCAHMRHDKVFIVPERLSEFTPNNPNSFGFHEEAYIGVPLFSEGKCIAFFGMIWSSEGASKNKLSWSFIEMFLHSLEDLIVQRLLEGRGFVKEMAPPESTSAKVIPLTAITATQSLKPYARSLSHELRTPMQGVVGMLDIMYSTVLDAIENQQSDRIRSVFTDLKTHIEVVQESSRRAVEAADNVVHAYDLNMQMPETPLSANDLSTFKGTPEPPLSHRRWPSSDSIPVVMKRKRTEELNFEPGPPLKRMFTMTEAEIIDSYCAGQTTFATSPSTSRTTSSTETSLSTMASSVCLSAPHSPEQKHITSALSPTHRRVITRDFMRSLVNEALRNGRPTSEVREETDLGEHIHITSIGSNGETQDRTIHLEIGPDVPEVIITEEQHLQFALQKLVDNAIKFTEHGTIRITVKIVRSLQVVEIWVVDTGCGISEESKASLFKPHFQEDASISRSRDGLGLSLFNAKAHVRKNLGGDVTLERSCTHGPHKGSEFLIRLPISALETGKTDTPLVGTPPPAGFDSPRLSPLPEPFMEPRSVSADSRPRQKVPKSGRKRVAFNPRLAEDYPLNILIAEDNAINRDVAVGSLNKLGYNKTNVTLAYDGAEAVKHYEASLDKPAAERFNMILMDIWMPNLDGYGATTQIMNLAQQRREPTKVIAVTADITEDSVDRAKAAGMQGFLAKPYKVFDIERLIVEHFEKCC